MRKMALVGIIIGLGVFAAACSAFMPPPTLVVANHFSNLVLYDENLCFGAGYCLYCLNVRDQSLDEIMCSEDWVFQDIAVDNEHIYSQVKISPGREVFFVGIDRTTGEPVWHGNRHERRWTANTIEGGTSLIDGEVIVAQDGRIYVLDKLSGDRLWRSERNYSSGPVPFLVHDDLIWYVTNRKKSKSPSDGKVLAVEPKSGHTEREVALEPNAVFDQLLHVDNEWIVGRESLDHTAEDRIFAVSQTQPDDIAWDISLTTGGISHAVVRDGLLIFTDGRIHALNLDTGQLAWAFDPEDFDSAEVSLQDSEITVPFEFRHAHNSVLYALDAATGKLVWKSDPPEPVRILVDKDVVYVASKDSINVIDLSTGELLWKVDVDSEYQLYFEP